jgi:hypothetical protein
MKNITITIEVEDDFDAYRLINKINYEHTVVSAEYNGNNYEFNEEHPVKDFLK